MTDKFLKRLGEGDVMNLLEPLLVTTLEAAKILSLSPQMVAKLTYRKEMPCIRLGRAVRYSIDDLRNWIASKREPSIC